MPECLRGIPGTLQSSSSQGMAWLFKAWAADEKASLLIRRSSPVWLDKRPNFKVIFCDNSPAHWTISKAYNFPPSKYTGDKAWELLRTEIPLFTTLSQAEQKEIHVELEVSPLECVHRLWEPQGIFDLSDKGWRVDHLFDVGVGENKDNFSRMEHVDLRPYFLHLMSPANIFLTPKNWSDLGRWVLTSPAL